jgi:FkbM family methyltransferase
VSLAESLSVHETVIDGSVFKVRRLLPNPLSRAARRHKYERWLDAVLFAGVKCRPGDFVDVGVNIGQTFFKALAILGRERQYLGFEPQITCCSALQTFIEDNGLKHCRIFPFGLSNENRVVKLYIRSGPHDECASVVANFRPASFYDTFQYVSVRKGDEVLKELDVPSVSVIKIDVEGGELEVIEGLLNTISATRPVLIFEVLNHFLFATNQNLDAETIRFRQKRLCKLEKIVRDNRYRVFNILPGDIIREVAVIEPKVSSEVSLINYLALPEEHSKSFIDDFPGRLALPTK